MSLQIEHTTQYVNYEVLNRSLEGIPCPEHFFEIVLKTEAKPLLSELPLRLFPAIRVLFETDMYCIVRAYIGSDAWLKEQHNCMVDFYIKKGVFDYTIVPPGLI